MAVAAILLLHAGFHLGGGAKEGISPPWKRVAPLENYLVTNDYEDVCSA